MNPVDNLAISTSTPNYLAFKSSEVVKPKYKSQVDKASFSMASCNENLQRNRAGYFQFINRDYNFSGTINNKTSGFDVSEHGLFFPSSRVEGIIDDKQISFDQQAHFAFLKGVHTCSGQYGEKSFDLKYTNGIFANGTISGTINGEPIDIQIPGTEVPNDSDVRDIITTLMAINGQKAVSIGGRFRSMHQAEWQRQASIEAMATQACLNSGI